MKGQAIHMEQLIIIIICIIVLLAVVAFFLGLWNPSVILYQAKLRQACSVLQNNGCQSESLEPSSYMSSVKDNELGGRTTDPLTVYQVCERVLGKPGPTTVKERCLKACGCIV